MIAGAVREILVFAQHGAVRAADPDFHADELKYLPGDTQLWPHTAYAARRWQRFSSVRDYP